jgi:hypothetical protein
VIALGFAMMGLGLLLYLLSVGSNAFGIRTAFTMPLMLNIYFFAGIAFNLAGAYIVIRR